MTYIVKEIMKILNRKESIIDLEQEICKFIQKIVTKCLGFALEEMDKYAKEEKKREGWKVERRAERTITFMFGEVTYKRTLMYDQSGKTRYPLDEMLGFAPKRRYSPYVMVKTAEMATSQSFRRVASVFSELTAVQMSHQTAHKLTREVGMSQLEKDKKEIAAMNEATEFREGRQAPEYLFVEADGVYVKTRKKGLEIKQGICYLGWEKSGKRILLKDVHNVVSTDSIETFWDSFTTQILNKYDLENTQIVYNSDGGNGYTPEHLEKLAAVSKKPILAQLDPFHVQKAIRKSLMKEHKELIPVMRKAIKEYKFSQFQLVLDTIESRIETEKEQNKWQELKTYLSNNWDRLKDWRNEEERAKGLRTLGTMESHQRPIAYRMKRQGKHWSPDGASVMSALIVGFRNQTVKAAFLERFKETKQEINQRKQVVRTVKEKSRDSIGVKFGRIPFTTSSSWIGKMAKSFGR